MTYAEVIVDRALPALDRTFIYKIPEEQKDALQIGSSVKVPFGNAKKPIGGTVTGFRDDCDLDSSQIKEIASVETGEETVDSRLVQLAFWMSRTYGSTMTKALHTVFPARKKVRRRKTEPLALPGREEAEKLPAEVLSSDQEAALQRIRKEWQGENRPVLIHGVTGSGKTLIYMELIEEVLQSGKQAIVLIPEIALTYQTVLRFVRHFGEGVSFLHSRLSSSERYDQFKAAKSGKIRIMVGPRSALFTPFPDLGLIVIDEEHEPTYHSEQVPRYHARETAIERAKEIGAHVVLGSATPSLEAYHRARTGSYALVTLKERFGKTPLPRTICVDMRQELREGNRSPLSGILLSQLADCLADGSQAMLFLNRRGYAGFVSCRSCGCVIRCPHCDVAMTEHRDGSMVCHYCGHREPLPPRCPNCGEASVHGMKIGTQQLETVLKKEFPTARILRMDLDTTRGKEGHQEILSAFGRGEADILLGTQMIVKGHDYPNVALVGVIMADLSLNLPDFRAAERTFSLITQAVGRSGRGKRQGLAVIQTYQPEHYAIRYALAQDYERFYEEESTYRRMLGYPPIGGMAAVHGSGSSEDHLSLGMRHIRQYLESIDTKHVLHLIGPAPETVGRIRDQYRQVLYIRAKDQNMLSLVNERMEKYLSVNEGYDTLSIQFDLNAE